MAAQTGNSFYLGNNHSQTQNWSFRLTTDNRNIQYNIILYSNKVFEHSCFDANLAHPCRNHLPTCTSIKFLLLLLS